VSFAFRRRVERIVVCSAQRNPYFNEVFMRELGELDLPG
jgi:hypothetical protein